MARLSDVIEELIKELIMETGGEAEIQRNAWRYSLNVCLHKLIM